ncbi:MAG: hypothetical protein NTW66_01020 [Candidatus Magasanikbacteria bacterium]|nr:hypothetical protein [Candidatus Magasanikbacteria bacterium]
MPENDENFSAHTIGTEKPKRKVAPRKKIAITEKRLEKDKKIKIEKELVSIYEDSSGKIPNMHEIKKRKHHPIVKGVFYLLFIGAIMAAAAWAGFFYLPGKNTGSEQQLSLDIKGPVEITVGATTTYVISFENKENIQLNGAVLTVNYPDGFAYLESNIKPDNGGATEWRLGDLKPHETGEIKITGQNYGALNQEKSWRALVNYMPENFQSELQVIATLSTKITDSPFDISISGPDKAIIGDEAKYSFKVIKKTSWLPAKFYLRPSLPANFYVTSSTPPIDKDGTWRIKSESPTSTTSTNELIFSIIGKYTDQNVNLEENTSTIITAELQLPYGLDNRIFEIGRAELATELIKSSQTFSLAINGAMIDTASRPGDTLNVTLYVKNTGKDSLKNASLKLSFDAPALKRQSALNWAAVEDKLEGNIVGEQVSDTIRRGTITWTSQNLPSLNELKPGQEATVDIRLPIRSTDNFDMSNLAEFTIKAIAEIVYKDKLGAEKSLSSNPIAIILNSDLSLEVRDSTSAENERDIQWILSNSFHPLKNIELTATLFGDANFIPPSVAPAGSVSFDADLKQISWKISEMPESVDILALPFSVNINKINPTQNTLISKVKVRAEDAVSGKTIEFMGDEIPMKAE